LHAGQEVILKSVIQFSYSYYTLYQAGGVVSSCPAIQAKDYTM